MITVKTLLHHVSRMTRIPVDVVRGPSRIKHITRARFAVCLVASEQGRPYNHIARELGGRDHTSIMNAVHRAKELESSETGFRLLVKHLRQEAAAHPDIVFDASDEVKLAADKVSQRKEAVPIDDSLSREDKVSIKDVVAGTDSLARAISRARRIEA